MKADGDTGTAGVDSAARVLALAQKLHDEYVAAGQNTREKLISEGQSRHDQVVVEATARQEQLLSTGQAKYDELVSAGKAKHDALIAEAEAPVAEAQHPGVLSVEHRIEFLTGPGGTGHRGSGVARDLDDATSCWEGEQHIK
jgi:hypothetical protein